MIASSAGVGGIQSRVRPPRLQQPHGVRVPGLLFELLICQSFATLAAGDSLYLLGC
jgi:hypothetical protein